MPNHRLVPVAREASSLLDIGAKAVPTHERMFAQGPDGAETPEPATGAADQVVSRRPVPATSPRR
jgi:hypothetical protein